MSPKQIAWIAVGIFGLLATIILPFQLLVTVGADEIVVHQGAIDGEISVWSTPGLQWQNFGRITTYKKSDQFWFGSQKTDLEGKNLKRVGCIKARFNDGGNGNICGSLSFDLPIDAKSMAELHAKFGSQEAIESRLIRQSVTKAVYMSGPLMSSKQSAGERRAELINFITDQASRGVYQTESTEREVPDLLSGEVEVVEMISVPKTDEEGKPILDDNGKPIYEKKAHTVKKPKMKTVTIVMPKKGENDLIQVQEPSAISRFNINLYNLAITGIEYDKSVNDQIKKQQSALMEIQTAMARAKEAEQKVLTVEKEGQATAAEAKWKQEKEKATAVTKAQQNKEVAALDLEAAKLQAQAKIERGKGEAEAKKLVMDADGALDKKLNAWVEVQKVYASQIGKQRWVPEVVIGGSGAAATDVMQMLQVKAAKDLALDMRMKK